GGDADRLERAVEARASRPVHHQGRARAVEAPAQGSLGGYREDPAEPGPLGGPGRVGLGYDVAPPRRSIAMAKANPLQEQLLKAGLVKKSKVSEVARQQTKARHGKAEAPAADIQRDAERARMEKVERDRALE